MCPLENLNKNIENALLSTKNFKYLILYVLSMNSHCNRCQRTPDNIGLAYRLVTVGYLAITCANIDQ